MNAAEHLEQHLGPMARGWSSISCPDVEACLFKALPFDGIDTLVTLGLSDQVLAMSDGRSVRQELLITLPHDKPVDRFAKLLLHVAERLREGGRALLRGEVVALESQIIDESPARALYTSMPVVFPEALATLRDTSPPTVFVWLFPLLPTEAALVESAGWNDFEDRLASAQPDLFDLTRKAVV
ncbi:MAG TPA: suppressor of fused domain protein [Polyangiales bacterium]|nr:suppressor of fused domain protein [Polyangiales bacterium]